MKEGLNTRTYLADTFFAAVSLVLATSLIGLFVPELKYWPAALWAMVLGVTAWDRRRLPHPKEVSAAIEINRTVELGKSIAFRLQVNLERHLIPHSVAFLPPFCRSLEFPARELPLKRMGQAAGVDFQIDLELKAIHLGYDQIDRIELLIPSPFRFWRRSVSFPIPAKDFRVVPSLKRIEEQRYREIRNQTRLLYQGSRRNFRTQSQDQFHSIRKYQFPDPIRHIDPKKTAKFNELMTRTYDTYFDHHVVLGLDVGRAMEGDIAAQPKQDYYLASLLAIAENAVQSRDRVSLFSFSQKLHYIIRSTKQMHHFHPVFEAKPAFRPREEESNYDLIQTGLQSVSPQRALFVLFTDVSKPSVQEALVGTLRKISQKHLCLVASVVDDDRQISPAVQALLNQEVTLEGYTRLLYNCWMNDRLKFFTNQISGAGAGIVMIPHTYWMSAVHRLYEELRRSTRL